MSYATARKKTAKVTSANAILDRNTSAARRARWRLIVSRVFVVGGGGDGGGDGGSGVHLNARVVERRREFRREKIAPTKSLVAQSDDDGDDDK